MIIEPNVRRACPVFWFDVFAGHTPYPSPRRDTRCFPPPRLGLGDGYSPSSDQEPIYHALRPAQCCQMQYTKPARQVWVYENFMPRVRDASARG